MQVKDLFDYLIYGTFGVAIYWAYQNYQKSNELKKEKQATLVEISEFKNKFYQVYNFIMPEFLVNQLDQFKEFQVRPDDIWVTSFPKSGKNKSAAQ